MIAFPMLDDTSDNNEFAEQDALSQDLVFDLLSSPRRRFILYYLRTETESVKLTDLADKVAAWECETPAEELTGQERKRAYVSLYQTHVPKLVDAGLIHHDEDSGMLQLTDRIDDVTEFLPNEDSLDIRWELIYISFSIIGIIIFFIGLSNESVFGMVSVSVAGGIILVSLVITTVIHFISARQQEQRQLIEVVDNDNP